MAAPRGPPAGRDFPALRISSFGRDEAGELYVCVLGGRIYRISATSL